MLVLERRALQELGAVETCLLRALLEGREHSINLILWTYLGKMMVLSQAFGREGPTCMRDS